MVESTFMNFFSIFLLAKYDIFQQPENNNRKRFFIYRQKCISLLFFPFFSVQYMYES